ncbi:MAG: hypothetical protein ACLPWF_16775 [Bryobacteraceae bacterium]
MGIIFFAHGAQKLRGWFGGPGLKATVPAVAIIVKGSGAVSLDHLIIR